MVNTKRDFNIGAFGEQAVRNFYKNKQVPIHVQLENTNLNRPAFAQKHNKHEADIVVIQKVGVYMAEVKTKTSLWKEKYFVIDKSD